MKKNITAEQKLTFIIKQVLREQEDKQTPKTKQPSDVSNLDKTQQSATGVLSKAKTIDNLQEFPGAFKNWINTLGIKPGKVAKAALETKIRQVLIDLGFK